MGHKANVKCLKHTYSNNPPHVTNTKLGKAINSRRHASIWYHKILTILRINKKKLLDNGRVRLF